MPLRAGVKRADKVVDLLVAQMIDLICWFIDVVDIQAILLWFV